MFNDINFTIVYYESVKNYTLFTTVVCICHFKLSDIWKSAISETLQ